MTAEARKRALELIETELFFYGKPQPSLLIDASKVDTVGKSTKPDFLEEMYAMQAGLDARIVAERGVEKTLDEWVLAITVAMESEIDEVRGEINWKHWKNPKEVNVDALQGEVIDLVHFVLSLCRIVGMTPADIHRRYMEKNAENHARQAGLSDKEGYAVEGGESE